MLFAIYKKENAIFLTKVWQFTQNMLYLRQITINSTVYEEMSAESSEIVDYRI